MTSLYCGFPYDLDGMLLTDYLINQTLGYLNVGRCLYLIQIDIVKLHERSVRAVLSVVAGGRRRARVSYGNDGAVLSPGILALGILSLR